MVEVEVDAKAVVDMLAKSQYSNNAVAPLLEDCRYLVSKIPQVRINHCYREANRCADKLARKGANQSLNFILYENPPVDLCEVVEMDCTGVSFARQCPGSFVSP
uniref:RNase H type-1 domain-containing protein n=1 Tax=Quercus lobata TaxID=97700 RepID=A0A7N2RCG3_QUELO